ncbi:MAG TPA: phage tail sheath C-terminal domain-containing protein [Chthoniobacterales bacterium]|nr:phage tail sheath C-terminal domain-containing protein [Chthoniobacterales bacterium]
MPSSLTYPGVYVEEIPSGVRTITGVSTSDTAFIDFFKRGPTDTAVRLTSYGDFERTFGGLDQRSEASYAIKQFYSNGGSIAWVVRVIAKNAAAASLGLSGGSTSAGGPTLIVRAASPGKWGNLLKIAVDHNTRDANSFNLEVREVDIVSGREQVLGSEMFRNLSMDKTVPRYAADVINNKPAFIQVEDKNLGEIPESKNFTALQGGTDGDEPGSTAWESVAADLIKGSESEKKGIYALDKIAPFIFNLLCVPAAARLPQAQLNSVYTECSKYCLEKRAFLLIDPRYEDTGTYREMISWMETNSGMGGDRAAVYFPSLEIPDPLNEYRPRIVGPSGTVAGIFARTDAARGVWKAPAGTDATLRGATLTVKLTDLENGALNPLGINALRNFPIFNNIVWGARTLDGADQKASEWKYIPVRRTALYIEESLYQGLKWVVFEPNDEPLWAQIRLNAGAFMNVLFRQGAFQGKTPREAYFVQCDRETTTQNDIDRGLVNILVGFAPLKPAEFVVIKLQQMAGQIQT